MRKLVTLLFVFSSALFFAQEKDLAKDFTLNFAVPDHPAFFILDNNPSNIIKPGNNVELFSVMAANILSGTSFVIPKDLSVEFAPMQLLGYNKVTFEDYSKKRILYDLKISIGAKSTQRFDSLNNLAFGLRFTWINNKTIKAMYAKTNRTMIAKNKFYGDLASKEVKYNGKIINLENMAEDSNMVKHAEKLYHESLPRTFTQAKNEIRADKDEFWNQFKFETSAAIKLSSPDTIITSVEFAKFCLWNSLALPVGKSAQLLIGLNYTMVRNDSLRTRMTDSSSFKIDTVKYFRHLPNLSARLYAGSNTIKAFVEGSAKYSTDRQMLYTLNAGAEFNIRDGVWAVLNTGNNWTNSLASDNGLPSSTSKWFFKIDVRYHIGEKKK